MKKLYFLSTLWLVMALVAPVAGQAFDNKGASAALHEARFHVFDYESRQAIARAGIHDKSGKPIGVTDEQGELVIKVPAIASDAYTVKAEGYAAMTIRLTQAARTSSDYDVFLPKSEKSHSVPDADRQPVSRNESPDLVKVYVKQDPASYKPVASRGDQPVEFAVQLSATSRSIDDKSAFKAWEEIGPVFIHRENGLFKVRIGPYATQEDAKQVLLQVKARGKKDAFIVVQKGIENHEPFNPATHYSRDQETFTEETTATAVPTIEQPASPVMEDEASTIEYKVRLVSYLKPGGFNTKDVDQLGQLESYRKGDWTILMIGGFTSESEAKRVCDIVIGKGFKDASVVIVRDGILELEH